MRRGIVRLAVLGLGLTGLAVNVGIAPAAPPPGQAEIRLASIGRAP